MDAKRVARLVELGIVACFLLALGWCYTAYAGGVEKAYDEEFQRSALVERMQAKRPGVPFTAVQVGGGWAMKPEPLLPAGTCDDLEDCTSKVEDLCQEIGSERDEDVAVEYGPSQTGGYHYCEGTCESGAVVVAICNPMNPQTIIDEPDPTDLVIRPLCAQGEECE